MSEEIVIKKEETKKLRVSIRTFGCQMNEYDTEVARGILEYAGYRILKDEVLSDRRGHIVADADVYLMNTCSVREHAEGRVYGRLDMLGHAKKERPQIIIGLLGCMVEEHREKLFRKYPQLDLMVGTRNLKELPSLIEEVRQSRRQVAKIQRDGISIEYTDQIKREGKHHAWLPIMTGCNKVCTFCIVPITRGPEVSMPALEVYREAGRLAGAGVKWITLLGQNVNSYNGRSNVEGGGWRETQKSSPSTFGLPPFTSFPELLDTLCQIDGLERISFTTSHPHDATEELFCVIARNPKISRRFHLPLQSGSNRTLKRMKRLHTYEDYKAKVDRMREIIPDVSVTTDILTGFSGETDEDHQKTLEALKEIRYDGAYIYKYSLRSGTPAANLPDDVPLEVKERRNAELLAFQRRIESENHARWIGRTVQVFVEGVNTKYGNQLRARSDQERRVVFEGPEEIVGSFQTVRVETVLRETLRAVRL